MNLTRLVRENRRLRKTRQTSGPNAFGKLVWILAAVFAVAACRPAAAAAPATVRATVLETEMTTHDREKLAFRGAVEVSGPAGRSYQVYFQIRLHGGDFLKLAGDKNLIVMCREVTTPDDAPTSRWTDLQTEFSLQEVEAAVNLPRGQESLLWVDCSVWDVTTKRYINSDFTVSTPFLVETDQAGKIVNVDPNRVWDRMFHSKDPDTRDLAARAAATTAGKGAAFQPVLIAALKDPDEVLRRCGALDLQTLAAKYPQNAAAVPAALKEAFTDKDAWVRLYAAEALWDSAKSEEVIPVAVGLLKEPELTARAGGLLNKIGQPAIPALHKMLEEGDEDARVESAVLLLQSGTESKAAVRVLIEALKKAHAAEGDGSKNVAMLQNNFDAVGPRAKEAVPVLVASLADRDVVVQATLIRALGQVGPDASAAVDSLVKLLKDDQGTWRPDVILALRNIGPGAAAAVPPLNDALKDQDGVLRIDAARALWAIQKSDSALSVLFDAVRDQDEGLRRKALQALGEVGIEGKGAMAAVARALHEDKSRDVRLEAMFALRPFGASAVPDLLRALKDSPKEDRNMVIVTLGDMAGEARSAVPAIVAALPDADTFVHAAAVSALKKIDPEAARQAGAE